jgi:hypothetical protein
MKNSPDKPLQRRRLVLRREIITELTRPQLGKVAGGGDGVDIVCTYFSGCPPTQTSCPA